MLQQDAHYGDIRDWLCVIWHTYLPLWSQKQLHKREGERTSVFFEWPATDELSRCSSDDDITVKLFYAAWRWRGFIGNRKSLFHSSSCWQICLAGVRMDCRCIPAKWSLFLMIFIMESVVGSRNARSFPVAVAISFTLQCWRAHDSATVITILLIREKLCRLNHCIYACHI